MSSATIEALKPTHQDDSPGTKEVAFRPTPWWKRTFDIVGAAFLLITLSPLLLLVGIYIKVVSPGPILFFQDRLGGGAKYFSIYKFRTMSPEPEGDSHSQYIASLAKTDEPVSKPQYQSRLILGGALLRSLSLDELPQLVNVIQGKMSLIGPRPEVLKLEDYEDWQLRRFEVLPGISGLWQVSGKNKLTFNQMVQLDIRYIDTLSMWLDFKIAMKTLGVVILRRNH